MVYTVINGVVCTASKYAHIVADKKIAASDLGITRRVVRQKGKPASLKKAA